MPERFQSLRPGRLVVGEQVVRWPKLFVLYHRLRLRAWTELSAFMTATHLLGMGGRLKTAWLGAICDPKFAEAATLSL